MVECREFHHLPTSLSSEFQTSPRQVNNLTSSARKTAVVDMNMSPGLVLAYRMDRPSTAFCPVSVTKLRYFSRRFSSAFFIFVSEVILSLISPYSCTSLKKCYQAV